MFLFMRNKSNFAAGPSKLPLEVLREVQSELLNYRGTGMSVMELAHRDPIYNKIHEDAKSLCRSLLKVPDNYKILFTTGGGTGQMAIVCMNLMGRTGTADYVITGKWSQIAFKEARKFGEPRMVFPKIENLTSIPDQCKWNLNPNASFLYYCDNDTADGIEFNFIPETNGVPLVCDMSSNFMSRPVDVSKFGIIFAGAQKNAGIAGITIAIVRDDLLGSAMAGTSSIWDYKIISDYNSTFNTIPSFVVYVMDRVFAWVDRQGGVGVMNLHSKVKSQLIYNVINNSQGFYNNSIKKRFRSRMNIPFRILNSNVEIEEEFVNEAKKRNMINLKSFFGGLRISLYNAMTIEETKKLANFMRNFCEQHQKC